MVYLGIITLYIATPVWILLLCKKNKSIQKIGEVLMAYFVGLLMAVIVWLFQNTGVIDPDELIKLRSFQQTLCESVIPFAIPLMLFSSNLTHLRKQLSTGSRALITGVVAVFITATLGALIFHKHIGPDMYKAAGIMTGLGVGGTPNMAALQYALKLSPNIFMRLQASEMLISFVYLLFLFTIGKVLFRKFLPKYVAPETSAGAKVWTEGNYYFMRSSGGFLQMFKSLGVALIIVGLAVGSSMLIFGNQNVPYIMLSITTLSLAASFVKPVRNLRYSFDVGMFLVLIFNVTIASMVDFSSLFNTEIYYMLGYVSFVIFGALAIHALMCKLWKVDADTFMVSSNALINSVPFVPVVAAAIGNRQVILVGITVGIAGYALGNYVGFAVAEVLKNIL